MQQQRSPEERDLLGSLYPGQRKLKGKTFYLDNVKKRPTAVLLEAISLLGGRVESFLHKDVNFLVTGNQEYLKEQSSADAKAGTKGTSKEPQPSIMTRESVTSDKRRLGTPRPMACGSRGKALLEKAICNNERLQRNSVLTNAQSWGVKILYADDVILYLKQLNRESLSMAHKKQGKANGKQQGCHVVKAAALRSPYLKIEDMSRKFKPLHMQSMTFPSLWYSGRYSPFECPRPPQFEKQKEQGQSKGREKKKAENSPQDKSKTPLTCNPSHWKPRKKDQSYCECCQQQFTNLEEHLQSDQHRAFVLDLSNYRLVDQLITQMLPGFDPDPPEQSQEMPNRPPTPMFSQELEPVSDTETEHAIQSLQRQGSSLNPHMSSPTRPPPACGPCSPSPRVLSPNPDPDPQPADLPLITNIPDCQVPNIRSRASSPVMPVLDAEPQTLDIQPHLSPCPDLPCISPDPYSLPPALSPQLHYSLQEPHCLFSDPPVLSPQHVPTEEEAQVCEMDTWDPFSNLLTLTHAEESTREKYNLLGFNRHLRSTRGAARATQSVNRKSRSLPRQTATAPNHRKRCRSASPDHSRNKRRKITEETTTHHPKTKTVSTCAIEELVLKQIFSTFCVPQTPDQTDISGHLGKPLLSWSLSSRTKTFDPLAEPPKDRSHTSQDSQRSQSLSTSVCIESALIPDPAALCPSSDSDWDCELISRLTPASAAPLLPAGEPGMELDTELLHRPCTWMHDATYESQLHTALQPSTPATCVEDMDTSSFSRTVVQIVKVQH